VDCRFSSGQILLHSDIKEVVNSFVPLSLSTEQHNLVLAEYMTMGLAESTFVVLLLVQQHFLLLDQQSRIYICCFLFRCKPKLGASNIP